MGRRNKVERWGPPQGWARTHWNRAKVNCRRCGVSAGLAWSAGGLGQREALVQQECPCADLCKARVRKIFPLLDWDLRERKKVSLFQEKTKRSSLGEGWNALPYISPRPDAFPIPVWLGDLGTPPSMHPQANTAISRGCWAVDNFWLLCHLQGGVSAFQAHSKLDCHSVPQGWLSRVRGDTQWTLGTHLWWVVPDARQISWTTSIRSES